MVSSSIGTFLCSDCYFKCILMGYIFNKFTQLFKICILINQFCHSQSVNFLAILKTSRWAWSCCIDNCSLSHWLIHTGWLHLRFPLCIINKYLWIENEYFMIHDQPGTYCKVPVMLYITAKYVFLLMSFKLIQKVNKAKKLFVTQSGLIT